MFKYFVNQYKNLPLYIFVTVLPFTYQILQVWFIKTEINTGMNHFWFENLTIF